MAGEGRGGLVTIAHTSLSPPASSSRARLHQMLDISQTQERDQHIYHQTESSFTFNGVSERILKLSTNSTRERSRSRLCLWRATLDQPEHIIPLLPLKISSYPRIVKIINDFESKLSHSHSAVFADMSKTQIELIICLFERFIHRERYQTTSKKQDNKI